VDSQARADLDTPNESPALDEGATEEGRRRRRRGRRGRRSGAGEDVNAARGDTAADELAFEAGNLPPSDDTPVPATPEPTAAAPLAPISTPVDALVDTASSSVAEAPPPALNAPVPAPALAVPAAMSLEELERIIANAGLIWIQTDAEKQARVAAEIVAAAPPLTLGRERPAPVVIEEGPLVQVETRQTT
jgi:ribonuclease E